MSPVNLLESAFSTDSLYDAWDRVRAKKAGPGVDGVTVFGFGRNLDRNLACIRHEVLHGIYCPDPVLRRYIPKTDGDFRRIGIPTVRDRITQRALLNCILNIVEPRLHESSYAYRPKCSVKMAISRIEYFRDLGNKWVARSDIDLCFDSIPHAPLLDEVQEWVGDTAAIDLIKRWLDAGYVDGAKHVVDPAGVPQGDVLSPVLSNIYLDAFDQRLSAQGETFVRYADDVLVVCKDRQAACRALARAGDALAEIGLRLDPEKSQVLSFSGGFKYLGTLFVGSMAIPAIRIERSDGSAIYVSGYESSDKPKLNIRQEGNRVRVEAENSSGLTEQQLCRLVAKEVYLAKKGLDTSVGRALLEAYEEMQSIKNAEEEHVEHGPSDWAYVA